MYARQVDNNYTETLKECANAFENDSKVRMMEKINSTMLEQKLIALLLIVITFIIPFVTDGDITFSFITLPLGIYLLFTKKKVIS